MPYQRPDQSNLYKLMSLSTEINLRHLSVRLGKEELESYIDRAAAAGIVIIKIIHGRSGGDMRRATHELLERHPLVTDFEYPAAPSEGGPGVTIAKLVHTYKIKNY